MTILTGDCRDLMPAHGPFDLILADPPYGDTSLAWDRQVDGWLPLARQRFRQVERDKAPPCPAPPDRCVQQSPVPAPYRSD